jgi:hypothetical protein
MDAVERTSVPVEADVPLIHCIYASAATRDLSTAELAALLASARSTNERLGLTGILLLSEGSFFQVLEGDPDVVRTLYAAIEDDPRHAMVTKIIEEPIAERNFEDWTMGYSAVSRWELAAISGVNDFFDRAQCFQALDAGRAKQLLGAFRDGRWRKRLTGARQVEKV